MDPVTHGIAGALIGKAFFSKRRVPNHSEESGGGTARVAIFAVTLGAVFPDVDVFADVFSRDPLGIARYHRGFTHSFIGLPLFAAVLAWLTRVFFDWYAERRGDAQWTSPSFAALFVIYAAGLVSHILLDGFTSFGTRMLNPFSKNRVAWDFVFIIDFVLTALVLLPQLAAWVHERRELAIGRAGKMWGFCTVVALGVWSLARAAEFPFSIWIVVFASAIFAALFFLPARNEWGSRAGRAAWCRAGFYVTCAYIVLCGFAHHAAMSRVREFASSHQIAAEKIGVIPLPPSLLDWNGLILMSGGVYQSTFSLRDSSAPEFRFVANSPPNRFTAEAAHLEPVETFLWFARFPVTHFSERNGRARVDYGDLRFFGRKDEGPIPFTFSVVFDSEGRMLHYGWVQRGPRLPRKNQDEEKVQPSNGPR